LCFLPERLYECRKIFLKTFTETFPNSARADECEYMRCYSYYKESPKVDLDQTNTSKAISLFQAYINSHPDSKRVKEATEIIDKCREKLELKEYKAAILYYNLGFLQSISRCIFITNERLSRIGQKRYV